jgi:hypothetical protein
MKNNLRKKFRPQKQIARNERFRNLLHAIIRAEKYAVIWKKFYE